MKIVSHSREMAGLAGTLAAVLALSAAATAKPKPPAAKKPTPAVKPKPAPQKPPPGIKSPDPFASLTPFSNGPGFVVGDPVASNTGAAEFGAGCTRWLYVMVGALPGADKSPTLRDISNYLQDKQRADFLIRPEGVTEVARGLGLTHVVTTSISGELKAAGEEGMVWREDGPAMKLELTVRNGANGQAVGEPISSQGSPLQIAKDLPQMARQLAQALKLSTEKIPETSGELPLNLQVIGALPWNQEAELPVRLWHPVSFLPRQTAFDRIMMFTPQQVPVLGLKNDAMPGENNPLLLHKLYYQDVDKFREAKNFIDSLIDNRPHSYQAAILRGKLAELNNNLAETRRAAQLEVRAAPKNPYAWLGLGLYYSTAADELRQGRYVGQISWTEWQELGSYYPRWELATRKAVQLDRGNPRFWQALSAAATFAGSSNDAIGALWKAQALAPEQTDYYTWGLEMFQPKWLYRPDQMEKLLAELTANPSRAKQSQELVFQYLNGAGWEGPQQTPDIQRLYSNLISSPAGVLGADQVEIRSALQTAWNGILRQPKSAASWKSATLTFHRFYDNFRAGEDPGVHNGPSVREKALERTMTGFRLFCARRWAELSPADGEAQLALAGAAIVSGNSEVALIGLRGAYEVKSSREEAISTLLEWANPAWTDEYDAMTPFLTGIKNDKTMLRQLAPDIVFFLEKRLENKVTLAKELLPILAQARKDTAQLSKIPNQGEVARRLIFYFEDQKNRQKSLEIAQGWVKLTPENVTARLYLARAHWAMGQSLEAMEEYRTVLRLDSENVIAAMKVAHTASDFRRFEEAEKLFHQILKKAPYSAHAWALLGRVYMGQNRTQDAVAAYKQCSELGEISDFRNRYVQEARMYYAMNYRPPAAKP